MFSDTKELYLYIRELGIDVVDFKLVDMWGRWRHISAPARKITQKVLDQGFAFDPEMLGFEVNDGGNLIFVPDPHTAFEEEWGDIRVLSLICNVHVPGEDLPRHADDPRHICSLAEKALAREGPGDQLLILPRFEFYVFDTARFENKPNYTFYWLESEAAGWNPERNNLGYYVRPRQGYQVTPPQDTLFDLRNRLVAMLEEGKVPVRHHHHHAGAAGQIEIEVDFNPPGRTADSFMMLKYIAKNLATKMARTATFMPKPIPSEAASGLHLHFKLQKGEENLFMGEESSYRGLNSTALNFMGGILTHMDSLMAFTNPSTNSYKRLMGGMDSPIYKAFTANDKSCAIRVPDYTQWEQDKCFELRIPDATCNPYLAFAAVTMAGLDGIRKKIDPRREGFGPYSRGDDEPAKTPSSLRNALKALESDHDYLTESGVFSQELIRRWIQLKTQGEVWQVDSRPHPYEFELYYDL